jgi:hypothetical protein
MTNNNDHAALPDDGDRGNDDDHELRGLLLLDARSRALDDREQELAEREQEVAAREQELGERGRAFAATLAPPCRRTSTRSASISCAASRPNVRSASTCWTRKSVPCASAPRRT